MRNLFKWTYDMHVFCSDRCELPRRELTAQFNVRFGTDRSYDVVRGFCKRNRYMTNRTGQYAAGSVPANKGMTRVPTAASIATQFKKGHALNTLPVGSRTKTSPKKAPDGTVIAVGMWRIKIAEPNTWEFEHRQLWKLTHGPIPSGHAVVFIDGDQDNVVLGNLILLTRGELAIFNKNYSHYEDVTSEQRAALITMARIQAATGKREFGKSERQIAIKHGLNPATAYARLRKGWPKVLALTAPLGTRYKSTEARQ